MIMYIIFGSKQSFAYTIICIPVLVLNNLTSLPSYLQEEPDMILQNIVSYVGQLDNHAPFLTVQETFDFAANCRIGKGKAQGGEDEILSENLTIDGLDLAVCRDTYVGDANNRGVSGGQRRRVTVGEMMVGQNPVACADEISTGLDAAVTYDISR